MASTTTYIETTRRNEIYENSKRQHDPPSSVENHSTVQYKKARSSGIAEVHATQHLKIAELFTQVNVRGVRYSQLITKGRPNIYFLNAKERTSSADLRWFEIDCPPHSGIQSRNDSREHKVIILMGATGSGKSTLINGMVNYILGVQWEDSYRFNIIREDEGAGRNQAHSQTSSVTAYTLHHRQGMAISHSITIIDTPGYGDTRGIERDKEITKTIHRFLTQNVGQIDFVHSVCFVAASGNSRLTHTQRYILDSVLSIFGKDVKNNIRLLVTFADNIDPPVADACREAGFPLPSDSDGVAFSKFNSSVLFVSNVTHGNEDENDFNFDKLFWDMGQENFKKFFDMLNGMKGCSLQSTREVIAHRQEAQQIVKKLEDELDAYLMHIENIEIMLSVIVNGYRMTEVTAPIVGKMKASYEKAEGRKLTNVGRRAARQFAYRRRLSVHVCSRRLSVAASLWKAGTARRGQKRLPAFNGC